MQGEEDSRRSLRNLNIVLLIAALFYIGFLSDNKNIKNKNMEKEHTFACAINCMDGRVQDAVKDYMKEKYHVDYVDMLTEPGPDRILAEHTDAPVLQDLKKRIDISVNHHGAKVVAIAGHFGCAGNPVDKEKHLADLKEAKKTVESFGFNVEVILLWVDNGWLTAEEIID